MRLVCLALVGRANHTASAEHTSTPIHAWPRRQDNLLAVRICKLPPQLGLCAGSQHSHENPLAQWDFARGPQDKFWTQHWNMAAPCFLLAEENPKQSNIFKAMRTARFKNWLQRRAGEQLVTSGLAERSSSEQVLLVIDAATSTSGPGTPFTRLWCGYELSLCADRSNAVVDIVTSNGSGSQ
eukprot:6480650-Amphidinium_carterae.1